MSLLEMPSKMAVEDKYALLLYVFTAYVMLTTGCTQDEAIGKIADLCVKAQLGGK
jgi:hypothetical protein